MDENRPQTCVLPTTDGRGTLVGMKASCISVYIHKVESVEYCECVVTWLA